MCLNIMSLYSLFQALWLSENQAKPMLAFQTDYDDATGDQAGLFLMNGQGHKIIWVMLIVSASEGKGQKI